jgi:hypothetical protein
LHFLLANFMQLVLTRTTLLFPVIFLLILKALLILFEQRRHTAQVRQRGKAVVRLATGVAESCKRIRNTLKAIETLTTLEAACF